MLNFRIIDLTHRLLPGEEQYSVEIKQRGKLRETATGDIMHDVSLWSHSGTHVEVSLHFYAGGKDTSDFPPETFVGQAIRLDFRTSRRTSPSRWPKFKRPERFKNETSLFSGKDATISIERRSPTRGRI